MFNITDAFHTPLRDREIRSFIMEFFMLATITTFLVWSIQFHWKRRHMYKLASKIQGPFAFPLIGNAHMFVGSPKDIFNVVDNIRYKYSGVIRFWLVHKLFFAIQEPEDLEVVLNSPNSLSKEKVYRFSEPCLGHGLFTAPVPTWKKHRKLINPTFNQKILDTFVEVYSTQTNILIDQMKPYCGKDEVDIFRLVGNCTLDIICETAMGVEMNCQTTEAEFPTWADTLMEICITRMFFVPYHFDFIFKRTRLYPIETELVEKCKQFSGKVVYEKRTAYKKKMEEENTHKEDYMEEPKKREALLDSLIKLSYEGTKFSDEEMRDEVNTFIIAGSDTSAVANSCILLCLAIYQDVQQKVYEEIIDVIGPDCDFEPEDLSKLKYTERVIKESLRLFPVAPFIVRYLDADLELPTCRLPGNSSPFIMIHAVHTNAKYWPNPFKFDPDRFLPEEVAKRHPYTYLPFSLGPRNCIGIRYAMMQMKCLIGQVVRKYHLHTKYKHVKDVKIKSHIVMRPCDGYQMSIEQRTAN